MQAMAMTASARTDALRFSNRALLLLKVSAFVVMVFDHLDMFGFTSWGVHSTVGRAVFPIFGAVFAYNLGRMSEASLLRVMCRLLALAFVSQASYWYLQGQLLPINIMATLGLSAFFFWSVERTFVPGIVLALALSMTVDYLAFGVVPVVFMAYAFQRGRFAAALSIMAFAVALTPINGNLWALLALPLILLASEVRGDAPRLRWLFWAGYPVHLALLAIVRAATV